MKKYFKKRNKLTICIVILLVIIGGIWYMAGRTDSTVINSGTPIIKKTKTSDTSPDPNPLSNRKFYTDTSRDINKLAESYLRQKNVTNLELIKKISSNPGTTWLTGPSISDPTASRDVNEVLRTSTEAASQNTVPVYQLYAAPNRDACAGYSSGGFKTNEEYLKWIEQILVSLKGDTVFSVEADAVAQTLLGSCLSEAKILKRYELLRTVVTRLGNDPNVLAVYIDAGHAEWFPDPSILVEPLRKSGIDQARGIAVNVSFFESTSVITPWAQQLVNLLGGDKGVIIDTSRNGKGAPDAKVTGEARWCNPKDRGAGNIPTTDVNDSKIDAYFWGKIIGESDGACFGNPAAGVFVPEIALSLALNASF